jgi:hypothetical protein
MIDVLREAYGIDTEPCIFLGGSLKPKRYGKFGHLGMLAKEAEKAPTYSTSDQKDGRPF